MATMEEMYKVASGLDKKNTEKIQVATLRHRLEIECLKVYFNFKMENEGDHEEIEAVERNSRPYTVPGPGLTVPLTFIEHKKSNRGGIRYFLQRNVSLTRFFSIQPLFNSLV